MREDRKNTEKYGNLRKHMGNYGNIRDRENKETLDWFNGKRTTPDGVDGKTAMHCPIFPAIRIGMKQRTICCDETA